MSNLFWISVVNAISFRECRCHAPVSFLRVIKYNYINFVILRELGEKLHHWLRITWRAVMRSVETSPGKKSKVLPFFSSIIDPRMSLADGEPFSPSRGLISNNMFKISESRLNNFAAIKRIKIINQQIKSTQRRLAINNSTYNLYNLLTIKSWIFFTNCIAKNEKHISFPESINKT